MENKENIFDSIFNEFMDSTLTFLNSMKSHSNSGLLISESLELLSKFPNSDSVAFMRLNNDTFEFILDSVLPIEKYNYYNERLQDFIDFGTFGNAIQSGKFHIHKCEKNNLWYLFLPVFTTKSVFGIYVISTNIDFANITIKFLNVLLFFAISFGNGLENIELNISLSNNKVLLDQLIAKETIELVENNKELGEKIESLKSNLSMSIPHEVRTPINEILGMSNYLKNIINHNTQFDSDDIDDIIEIITDIKSSAERLRNLFENFIYHTRLSIISISIRELENVQSKITPYCDSVIYEQASLKANTYNRLDDLEINLVSATIKIGEEYLAKLVDELTDNALKYSEKGTKVSIYSSIESDYYTLTFADNGAGFPIEFLNQVDAYIQFERNKNEQQGLGLGLAICYKIVDLHNGEIEIDSKISEYTKITVKFKISTDFVME